MSELIIKGKKSKDVSFILGNLSTGEKNKGLNAMADFLLFSTCFIYCKRKLFIV